MTLKLISHEVREVAVGPTTQFVAGLLTVAEADARRLFSHPALDDVRISWVSPGDSARIIKVLDAVEPRAKGPASGGIMFPGFLGTSDTQGRGETHRLAGVSVMTAGFLPRAQEAVIEMSGDARHTSPFGELHNLVVEFTPVANAPWDKVDTALRVGLLKLAAFLGEAALGDRGGTIEILSDPPVLSPKDRGLPAIGTITNLQTQGTFKDVFVYGLSFGDAEPTPIDPSEIEDGAVVSGQYGHPSLKNPTYMHQNHPVVRALRARDGKDLRFAGVVLAPEPVQAEAKERVAAAAARLCVNVGFEGVVITKEGGGNADADISLKMDALADAGIPTVGIFAELAGPLGTAPSLVVPPEKSTALISTGNYDEILKLPRVERALGGATVDLVSKPATDAFELPTAAIYCSLSPLGAGRLTCASPPDPLSGNPERGNYAS
jgi:glycine reductase